MKMSKLVSILLFISISSFVIAQKENKIAFSNNLKYKQFEHLDSLKREIRHFCADSIKEPISFIAKYEKELLLFCILPNEGRFYLLSFNPEPYDINDFEWSKLYKVYGFDIDFNLLNISTFSKQEHIKSQLYQFDGKNLLQSEYRWPDDQLVFNGVKDFTETLEVLLSNLKTKSSDQMESFEKLVGTSLCTNYYIRLFAGFCKL